MIPTTPDIGLFWAKTDRSCLGEWHPLVTHLLEISAVTLELWDTVTPAAIKDRWASHYHIDRHRAGSWLALLAGVHDIGKASPVFQGASPEQRVRLATAGVSFRPQPIRPIRHGSITAAVLPALLQNQWPMLTARAARRYAVVSGMHHGSVLDVTTVRNAMPQHNPDQIGIAWWDEARQALFDAVLSTVGDPPPLPSAPIDHALATWAAGFISVADWIGSNTTYFPFGRPLEDPKRAFLLARAKAQDALSGLGWRHGAVQVPIKFSDAFPGWTANSTQETTMAAVQVMEGPGVVIVEAPMGQGKTEAALWTAAWAQEVWATRGFYVAMPTRASSDQLFDRVARHLTDHATESDRINAILLHGHAGISAQLQQMRQHGLANDISLGGTTPDQPADALLRAEWFTARRRGLLAPYGVGTVDQTLLGILENRHYFVRLHGLTGKTLIFDEVHAYDTYMETLFGRELEALGALGTPVVILSATLPAERRRTLLQAYARGAGWSFQLQAGGAPYPRVTSLDRQRMSEVAIPSVEEPSAVALRWFTGSEDDARERVVGALGEALAGGGTCAVICNTVLQAQMMFRLVEAQFPGEVELFHARYRYMDRARRQDAVLRAFGKDPVLRPTRRIVVATQVIEQSLDLDFDLMVTYFCPTDLLIQRLGRLQRHRAHDRARPASVQQPQLWILGAGASGGDELGDAGVPIATRFVYDPHVLVRSWAVLRGRTQLTIPNDIESCVEGTYAAGATPPADLAIAWARTAAALQKKVELAALEADRIMIPSLAEDGIDGGQDPLLRNIAEKTSEEEQDHDLAATAIARTRLGPPTVDVVILTPDEYERLDPVGHDGSRPLPPSLVAELIARSVSLGQRGLYRELLALEPPKAWRRNVWLSRHRLLAVDHRRRVAVGKYVLELSPSLGIVSSQPAGPEEE